MPNMKIIENLLEKTFKILNGLPLYITLEQKEQAGGHISEQDILTLIDQCSKWALERVGVSLVKTSPNFKDLSNLFLNTGFEHFSSRVEVHRDLAGLGEPTAAFNMTSLADGLFSEIEFKNLWERCMLGSDNKPTTLTMDQHLMSVKSELGEGWEKLCRVFYLENKPLGISIPHIEPGTKEEGRLFYFGLLPEHRGQGLSAPLHLQSLWALKEMGAVYYIGSTHTENKKMQRVFKKNGCSVKAQTETFYKYFVRSKPGE